MVYVCRSYALRGPMRANMEIECRTMLSAAEKKEDGPMFAAKGFSARISMSLLLFRCASLYFVSILILYLYLPIYLPTHPTLTVSDNFSLGWKLDSLGAPCKNSFCVDRWKRVIRGN